MNHIDKQNQPNVLDFDFYKIEVVGCEAVMNALGKFFFGFFPLVLGLALIRLPLYLLKTSLILSILIIRILTGKKFSPGEVEKVIEHKITDKAFVKALCRAVGFIVGFALAGFGIVYLSDVY